MTRKELTRQIEALGAVAVVRLALTERLLRVVEALLAGGVRGIEITLTVPEPFRMLSEVGDRFGEEALVGAGSVLSVRDAHRAVDAGARFVVSPVFDPMVLDACHDRQVPFMPGAFTPTEIAHAHDAGADLVKIFPAGTLGPGYIRAVLAPMPHLKLMPTGGVTPDNAGDWIAAGATCVGVGGALVDSKAVEEGRFDRLTEAARRLVSSVQTGREH